jgi:hypothetical protein
MTFPPLFSFNLKQWIEENRENWGPRRSPWEHSDFITVVHKGPTAGKQFHVNQGEEIFFQLEGELNCHYVTKAGEREVITLKPGEMFLFPGGSRAPGLWLSNANANRMRSMVGFGIAKTATINFTSQSRDMARDPGTR